MGVVTDVEAQVLSHMVADEEARAWCLIALAPEDIADKGHRATFRAIAELEAAGLPCDATSLAFQLARDGSDADVGALPTPQGSWHHMADLACEVASRRRVARASQRVADEALDLSVPLSRLREGASEALEGCTGQDAGVTGPVHVSEAVPELLVDMWRLRDERAHPQGVLFGIPALDGCLGGLRAGQLVVIGARPGVGKTALACQLVLAAARAGTRISVHSLEMSRIELMQRLLAQECPDVTLAEVRSGTVPDGAWEAVTAAAAALADLDVTIDDSPDVTAAEVRARARQALNGAEAGLVVVDYLQLLRAQGTHDSRAVEVGEMSRSLKVCAKELGVPVVALSQLNRQVTSRPDSRPRLSDLRESGSIEQDADIVLLLDRDEAQEPGDATCARLVVAKNRHGASGVEVPLVFVPRGARFECA